MYKNKYTSLLKQFIYLQHEMNTKIIVWILLVIVTAWVVVTIMSYNWMLPWLAELIGIDNNTQTEKAIQIENLEKSEISKNPSEDLSSLEKWVNLKWDVSINFNIPNEWVNWSIEMKNLWFLSLDKNLKSRLYLDNLKFQLLEKWEQWNIDLNWIDFILDNELLYFKWSAKWSVKWNDTNKEFDTTKPETLLEDTHEVVNEIINIINSWKYIKINSANNYYKLFPEIAKTTLWKMILTSLATKNPSYYLEKNRFWEQLKSDSFKKWWYETFFDIASQEWWKTYLKLKSSMCDIIPKIPEVTTQLEECNNYISTVNSMTNNQIELIQEWDQETVQYQWIINFKISYWNWELNKLDARLPSIWEIWYNNNILSINISPEMIKTQWESLYLTWEIDYNDKAKWNIKLSYKGLVWSSNFDLNIQDWSISIISWYVDIKTPMNQTKWDLSYENWKFNLGFSHNYKSYLDEDSYIKWAVNYNNWKLVWQINSNLWTADLMIENNWDGNKFQLEIKQWDNILLSLKLAMKTKDNFPESIKLLWTSWLWYNIKWQLKDWNLNLIAWNDQRWSNLLDMSWIFKKEKIDINAKIAQIYESKIKLDSLFNWDKFDFDWSININWVQPNESWQELLEQNPTNMILLSSEFSWSLTLWTAEYILPDQSIEYDIFWKIMEYTEKSGRDRSKANDLDNISISLMNYYAIKWTYPWVNYTLIPTSSLQTELNDYIDNISENPLLWEYFYMPVSKYWKSNDWFVLISENEISWNYSATDINDISKIFVWQDLDKVDTSFINSYISLEDLENWKKLFKIIISN